MASSESIDLLWNESIKKLKALVQDEEIKASKSTASIQESFQYFGNLYVRYTIIHKDLDTCYDLSVQPQKRLDIKSTLEHVICRVINLRHLLRKWSPPNNDVIVTDGVQPPFPWEYLDINKVLEDLSIAPSRLETTTPTYFNEDRQDAIRHRNESVARLLKDKFGSEARPWEEKTWSVESSLAADAAASTSGTSCAYDTTCATEVEESDDEESDTDSNSSDSETATEENLSEQAAAKVVQSLVRGRLSRKKVAEYKLWLDNLVGISSSRNSNGTELDHKLENNLTDVHNRRQQEQQYCKESYENDLHRLRDVVREEEGFMLQTQLREERIKWVAEHTIKNASLPDSFDGFYVKDTPPNDDDNDNQAKEKSNKDAKSKNTTDKKSKSADAESVELPTLAAPQMLLGSLKDCVQTYEERWMHRTVGPDRVKSQYHDTEMAKDLIIRDQVKQELTRGVEEKMLDNILKIKRMQETTKKPKKDGKGKGKKAKGKGKKAGGKKEKPLPGTKLPGLKDMDADQMLAILVQNGLVCCTPEEHTLNDFIGGFECARPKLPNLDKSKQVRSTVSIILYIPLLLYLHISSVTLCCYIIQQERWIPNDPSSFQLRKTVMDYCILLLGSESIKSNIQDEENIRSILFYGPEGSGKTLLVQTIASEIGALLINLSSSSIGSSFGGKEGATKLIHMAFTVAKAKEFSPVIIYIDDCHEFFMGKKSKRGGGGGANVNAEMQRFQKDLLIYKNQALKKDDRVIVIGCTNMPELGDTKLLRWKGSSGKPEKQGFFERAFYFPRANHADRAMLWNTFIQQRISEFNEQLAVPELDYDTLAFMSDGFNAGQILSTVHSVLSEERVKNLALSSSEPLSEKDFASFFSKEFAMKDDERFLNFTRQITNLETVWKGIHVVDKKADGKKKK